jgi:hypothetical protein
LPLNQRFAEAGSLGYGSGRISAKIRRSPAN